MKIAIIGATGAVGREMLADLELCEAAAHWQLQLFASPRSAGMQLSYRGRSLTVQAFSLDAVAGCAFILMSAGSVFSRTYAQALVAQGAVVIDNSSAWRTDPEIPLVVPEVNGARLLQGFGKRGIIANPNCSTIQLVVALEPLRRHFGLRHVSVATYQSVSGTGHKGLATLREQAQAFLQGKTLTATVYPQPIAFNALPAIGAFSEGGPCEEEDKMVRETRKILNLPELPVLATTVRVPVFHCHGEAVFVQLQQEVGLAEVAALLQASPGLQLVAGSEAESLPTALRCAGKREVFIARLRLGSEAARSEWLQFWNVADNLKKGAATNAVQILVSLLLGTG